MRNIKLTIAYMGANYCGWQIQNTRSSKNKKQLPSIQETIEKALSQIVQEKVKIIGSGRTDAGVHAQAQVANFHTKTRLKLENLQRALNSLLPDDIVITADFGYIRFHGKDAWYRYDYSDDELRAWARRVKRRGKIFFIYFNNDFDAYAPFNALKLIKFLRSR